MLPFGRRSVALLLFLTATFIHAQPARYELGRRLRVFEEQWERTPGEAARKGTVAPLNQAVTAFFTFRFGAVGQAIDQARFALNENDKPSPARRWAESLALFSDIRLLDTSTREIAIELKPFYDVPRPVDTEFLLRIALSVNGKESFQQTIPIKNLPLKTNLAVKNVNDGDHALGYEILLGKEKLARGAMQITFVTKLAERIDVVKKRAKNDNADLATEHATVQATMRLLDKLMNGKTEETDYPAARLIREAEFASDAIQAKKRFYTHKHAGDHWLGLAFRSEPKVTERIFPLRVLVPAKWNEANPPPLVVALHGAGGSENLVFDGYGNGKIVRLCRERGWMLVAPRMGFSLPLASILDELHGRYPFDRKNVLLIGHSMGAAAAVQAVSAEPKRYAGVVALGGSGTFNPSDDLKKTPFFISVGAQDFALGGARSLKDRLVKAGVEKVTLKELPDIEHLGIVQQSLGDSFQFFDAIVAANKAQ